MKVWVVWSKTCDDGCIGYDKLFTKRHDAIEYVKQTPAYYIGDRRFPNNKPEDHIREVEVVP